MLALIHFIHHNPVHHGLTDKIEDWRFGFYAAILSQAVSKVERTQVLELFGNAQHFTEFHQQMSHRHNMDYCIVE